MARRGESKGQKAISAPSIRHLHRKEYVLTVKGRPGPHSKETSAPLLFVLRDVIGIAKNAKEARRMLGEGSIKVNGKVRKKLEFPAGIFDIVEAAPLKKKYMLLLDYKGSLKSV
ncbi:30S ribosomal protein S4e [uncultured archaeon]|nr:30S ribosomal protein S4e [uncultured archaeon]